jgi:hypothetical protein
MGPKRKADAPKGEAAQKKCKKREDKESPSAAPPTFVEEKEEPSDKGNGKGKSINNKVVNKTSSSTSSKQATVTPAASPKPVVAVIARPAVLPVQSKPQASTPAKPLQSSYGVSKSSLVVFGVLLALSVVARYLFFASSPSAPSSTLPASASRGGPNKTMTTTMATTTKFAAKADVKPKPKPPPPLPKEEPTRSKSVTPTGTSSSSSSSTLEKASTATEQQIASPAIQVAQQQSNKSNTTTAKPAAASSAATGAKVTSGVRVAFGGWGQPANHEALIAKDVAGIWAGSRMVSSRAGKTHGIQLTSPPARAKSSLLGALSNSLGILDVLPASVSTVNRKFHIARPPLAGDCYCMQASKAPNSLTISIRLYQATNVTKIALFHRGDDFATAIKRFSLLSWNKDPLEERSKAKPRSLGVFEWSSGAAAAADELQAFDVTAGRGAASSSSSSSSMALTLQIDSNQGGFGNKTCVYRVHVFSR